MLTICKMRQPGTPPHMSARTAEIRRDTLETQIRVAINLDGQGHGRFDTGVPFLDHMLDQVARHGMVDREREHLQPRPLR